MSSSVTVYMTVVGDARYPSIPPSPLPLPLASKALQAPLPTSPAFLLSPEPNVDTYIDIYFLYPEQGLCNQAWG